MCLAPTVNFENFGLGSGFQALGKPWKNSVLPNIFENCWVGSYLGYQWKVSFGHNFVVTFVMTHCTTVALISGEADCDREVAQIVCSTEDGDHNNGVSSFQLLLIHNYKGVAYGEFS